MEILREVERSERGVYTGAIGWFDGAGDFELSVAIRTAMASEGRLLCSAGGGIVADSDPDRDWEETEVKLAALLAALGGRSTSARRGAVPVPHETDRERKWS
jgi:anthranilate/para-aminobenzoate synthase component I